MRDASGEPTGWLIGANGAKPRARTWATLSAALALPGDFLPPSSPSPESSDADSLSSPPESEDSVASELFRHAHSLFSRHRITSPKGGGGSSVLGKRIDEEILRRRSHEVIGVFSEEAQVHRGLQWVNA